MRKILLEALVLLFVLVMVALAFFIVGQPQSEPKSIAQVTETTWQPTTTSTSVSLPTSSVPELLTPTTTSSVPVTTLPKTSSTVLNKKSSKTTTTLPSPVQVQVGEQSKNLSFLTMAQSQVGLSGPYTEGGFWCAKFVQWVGAETNKTIPGRDSPSDMRRDIVLTNTPKPGDLVFIDLFAGTQPGSLVNHVGIVESIEGNTIHTIEGNADDSGVVVRLTRQIGDGYVKEFGSVD